MKIDAPNMSALWGSLIIEEFIRNKIDYFVISLGSRSTPLTVAVARNSRAKSIVCLDERAAAFHAIGYARATGQPAVVISTSGTAVANFFPGVIEASFDTVPLIVLSADRPPELRQTGANQTIQQVSIYGEYVKWQFDLPCPDEKIPPQMVLTTVDQVVYQARKSPCGPVHLNCMFREPLAPTEVYFQPTYLAALGRWQEQQQPYTQYALPILVPDVLSLQVVADIVNQTERGIITLGRLKSEAAIAAVATLTQKLNWPVFSDIRSGLRIGKAMANSIPYFDQMLLTDGITQEPIETVLQIGDWITSKRFLQFLEAQHPANYIAVIDHPFRHDPVHNVSLRIESSIPHFCQMLLPIISPAQNSQLLAILTQQSQLVNQVIDNFLSSQPKVSEPAVARIISSHITQKHGLFLANSMPIRDMDMYAVSDGPMVSVAANRGTSGIEGIIAAGAGYAVGLNASVTVMIGDLSFLYDLNSLSLLKSLAHPVIIVAINNDGGGIFSFLPIAKFTDVFEPFFGASHNLNFRDVSKMFGLDYYYPQTTDAFLTAYQSALAQHRSAVIEVPTDREENFALHQQLQANIISALQENVFPPLSPPHKQEINCDCN